MDESRQLYLDKPLTDAERHVANVRRLIAYMRERNEPRFTMRQYRHECGAPACALGHAAVLFGERVPMSPQECSWWIDFERRTFGSVRFNLFAQALSSTIRTPQQWADHAERWLAAQGL